MKLSEEMRNFSGMHFPYREYADKVAQLEEELEPYQRLDEEGYASLAVDLAKREAENDKLVFACKQALMAFEDGYDAPKIRQDLRDALIGKG